MVIRSRVSVSVVFCALFLLLTRQFAWGDDHAPEMRGFWVDAWHAGFKTPAQITRLVADVRAANCNAIFIQVRRRGDAYYDSNFEPKAADIDSGFDPLADLIAKAHDTSGGERRIEVHAWIVVYPIWPWRASPPPQSDHPLHLYPEFLTKNFDGEASTEDSTNYMFDPGHPGVQRHILNIALDLVTRYDIDGFHLDHIRYLGNTWGYNPAALERFRALHNRTDRPPPTDADWKQFRRDQVTDLVRKVYLETLAVKPGLKVSAAVNTRAPGITTTEEWPTSAAYSSTLQDWRAWLEEGIVDFATPMTYMDMDGRWTSAWERWSIFSKDHRYNRHVAIGPGIYLNTIENALEQIRSTREPTDAGNRADGVVLYSYAVTNKEGRPRSEFLDALVNGIGPDHTSVFTKPVPTPEMPWKTAPSAGHLMGRLHAAQHVEGIPDVEVTLSGPEARLLRTSATGFFGAVDLPPGDYTVTATMEGRSVTGRARVRAGEVSVVDLLLAATPLEGGSPRRDDGESARQGSPE